MSLEHNNPNEATIVTDSVENNMDDVTAMIAGILSDDPSSQLESTIKLRKFLTLEMTPSTESVIESGVMTRLVEFLKKEDSPKLQLEAAWAITNLTVDKREVVIAHGAVPVLVQLLASPNVDVPEQAIWALCNAAGGSVQNRDYVLSCGLLLALVPHLRVKAKLSILRKVTWILAHLFRRQPPPPLNQVDPVLAALEQILPIYDKELLKNACWAFCYLTKDSEEALKSIIKAGLVPKIVKLLRAPPVVIVPSLCTIGNIASGDKHQTQCVIDSGALPILANMLTQDFDKDNDKSIKKQACRTISNITAGTEDQIQAVIDANLIPILVNLAQIAEFDIKKEALWAISNITSYGSHDQIMYLAGKGCIKPLCDNLLMACPPDIITKCLDGLENILKVGEAEKNTGARNFYCHLIDDEEGQDKIEILRSHDQEEIYEKAIKMLHIFWP